MAPTRRDKHMVWWLTPSEATLARQAGWVEGIDFHVQRRLRQDDAEGESMSPWKIDGRYYDADSIREMEEEIRRLRVALQAVAGIVPWPDPDAGYVDLARTTLAKTPRWLRQNDA